MREMSLIPRALSTPDDTSTPGAPVDCEGLREVFRAQTAREHPVYCAYIAQQTPVEDHARAAWSLRARRRLGVEKNYVRGGEFLRLSNVVLGRHADRLDRRQAEARLHGLDPSRRFRAVEL